MKKGLAFAFVVLLMVPVFALAHGVVGGFQWELDPGSTFALSLGYVSDQSWSVFISKTDFSSWEGNYGVTAAYEPSFGPHSFGRFGLDLTFGLDSGSLPVYEGIALVGGGGYKVALGGGAVEAHGYCLVYVQPDALYPVIGIEFLFGVPPVAGE